MKILYFGDPIGCGGDSFEDEALCVKRTLKGLVFENKKFEFKATIGSMDLVEKQYDILIFDFGGMGIGCSGMVSSLSREILKLIEDRPNTLFVAWTSFTNDYLKDECVKELGDYPNLISYDNELEELIEKIKKWIKQC
jgi:hypothetical protein